MKIPFFNYPSVYKKYKVDFIRILDEVGNRGAFIMQNDLLDFEFEICNPHTFCLLFVMKLFVYYNIIIRTLKYLNTAELLKN